MKISFSFLLLLTHDMGQSAELLKFSVDYQLAKSINQSINQSSLLALWQPCNGCSVIM